MHIKKLSILNLTSTFFTNNVYMWEIQGQLRSC